MKRFDANLLKKICVIGLVVLCLLLYCHSALKHSQIVNVDFDRGDQAAYLRYAKNLNESSYRFIGKRNRMPVYPFLQSLIYEPNLTEDQFFIRGKYLNIALSVMLLLCLFFIFKTCFPLLQAVTFWMIVTFTVFLFKAAYFQAELLFYFLNFCGFLLMSLMFRNPSWQLAIATGVVMGITYLTKASILPGLALFTLFFLSELLYSLYSNLKNKIDKNTYFKKIFIPRLLSLVLIISCFLVTVYPYISTSKRIFGQYFYNVNSTFYIWYDSWEEAEQGTKAYGDGERWPNMPSESIPTLQKYVRDHTPLQIADRFWNGLGKVIDVVTDSYGYFKYVAIYLAIALMATFFTFRTTMKIAKKHIFLVLFGLTYFISYLLLYAWYTPIASGQRFVLGQFLPFVSSLLIVINVQSSRYPSINIGRHHFKWLHLLNPAILGIILFELYPILTHRILTMYAGS